MTLPALPGGVQLAEDRLALERRLSFEEWSALGELLALVDQANPWWLGDWLVWGEAVFGEEAYQAIPERAASTLQTYSRVARRIPPARRRAGLSFAHHHAVAALEPEEQERLLEEAERRAMSVGELRSTIRNEARAAVTAEALLITAGYEPTGFVNLVGRPAEQIIEALGRQVAIVQVRLHAGWWWDRVVDRLPIAFCRPPVLLGAKPRKPCAVVGREGEPPRILWLQEVSE